MDDRLELILNSDKSSRAHEFGRRLGSMLLAPVRAIDGVLGDLSAELDVVNAVMPGQGPTQNDN